MNFYCKRCDRSRAVHYRRRNPEKTAAKSKRGAAAIKARNIATGGRYRRDMNLRCLYGITLADYELMLKEQDGRCAICRTDNPRGRGSVFHVDHDHVTGRVRGLLCNRCNSMLGAAGEKPEVLREAAEYLEREDAMKGYADLHNLDEDDRIAVIGQRAMAGDVVAVCVDATPPDKATRYAHKITGRFPELEIFERFNGPTRGVVTLKVRKKQSAV